jgi:2-polyprenyl-6-methoxyphenol hydroxylase-like FAD-dependent oxidoreductase
MEAITLRVPGLVGYESEIAGFYPVIQVSTEAYTRGNVVLLGDAAHAMHPARGQGMNVALRGIERLVDCLPSPQMIADPVQLHAALQRYDALQKQANTRLLEVNHERAREDVGALRKYLRKVAADPRLTARYIRETTGYPPEPERQ